MSVSPLISVAELAAHPEWPRFDCRHDLLDVDAGERAYAAGHIDGARFLHLERDLSGAKTGHNGRHPLPVAATLAARLAEGGVDTHQPVVFYDADIGMFAARAWWLLRWLGHPQPRVLDGGLAAWCAAGGAITRTVPARQATRFRAAANPGMPTIDCAQVLANLTADNAALLVDARAPDRFAGENETLDPVAGHIPGARNRFFRNNIGSDGLFKPAAQLREEFAALLGARAGNTVIMSCGSGVSACHNLLALDIAQLPGARLYPGSWSEWCSEPSRPVACGT